MPRHEDIEQFKRVLASYGAGTAERAGTTTTGRSAPVATEPEEASAQVPDGLGDLGDLGDPGEFGEAGAPASEAAPEEGAPPDIGDLLSSLGGELAGASSAGPVPGDENLDLSALFGEEETRAVEQPDESEAPPRRGRQKREKTPRTPKKPRERPIRRAEPEPPPEEAAALEELAEASEETPPEGARAEELSPLEGLTAPEELASLEEFAAPEEFESPEQPPVPEEPAAPAAEPAGEEELPEFLEPVVPGRKRKRPGPGR